MIRMPANFSRALLLGLLTACLCALPAQAQDADEDRVLAQRAAKILMDMPEAEREAFTARLAQMNTAQRRAALKQLIARKGQKSEKSISDQLEKLWKNLPRDQRRKMLDEAMKTLETLPPAQRRDLLRQYREFSEALEADDKEKKQAAAKKAGKPMPLPERDRAPRTPLRQALDRLDKLLDKHGEQLDQALDQTQQVLGQARDYLELYRSMPREQREQVLKELEDGLKVFLEENVLPELEAQVEGLKEAREAFQQASAMLREYTEAFRNLPEEERRQLVRDLVDAGKLFFEESVKPELERQAKELRKEVRKFMDLPRDERRKRMRKMMRRMFR